MGFNGAAYTWTNKRADRAHMKERLDQGFINEELRMLFPEAFIRQLTALNIDHRPLLLNSILSRTSKFRPFLLETMWSRDPSAAIVISKAWGNHEDGNPLLNLSSN